MKKRKDSFFGLHFDYHANPQDGFVQGATLCESDIREICRTLKPDFIQIDCKGHRGWVSYPTKIGNAMPEFALDTLELWRRVTREEDVALYMHYSGVYDIKYCAENPDQAVMNPDGTLTEGTTRTDGKYVDELLIPQMLELAGEYKANGIWIDGDCWMATPDFRPESLSKFEAETGIDLCGKLPATPADPYYHEYREYHRELFRRYVRRYVDIVHEKYPDFEIASNWAFSDHMPERVCANVDFLSGDLNPSNGFNSARYAARALAQQGLPWDLMSWNFRHASGAKRAYAVKHPIQIMQEAAAVISLGGAFQDYVPQHRDGSPNMAELRNLLDVSEFVRKRKPYCFRGRPIHQAALLLSTYDRYREAKNLFSRTGFERTMGATALLCDIGQSLEIVCEHTLEKYVSEYEMIVVPELSHGLAPETADLLVTYAKNGGNLVLIGKNTCKIFAERGDLPFTVADLPECVNTEISETEDGHEKNIAKNYIPYLFTLDKNELGVAFSPCEIIANDAQSLAFVSNKKHGPYAPMSAIMNCGKGKIVAIGFDIGEQYLSSTQYLQRRLMRQISNMLYSPIVRVEKACGVLEVVALDKDGTLMIQLVNACGTHANAECATDDHVPPTLDIEISIALSEAPSALILQPEGTSLPIEYKNGRAYTKIPRVDIHSIIEVQK